MLYKQLLKDAMPNSIYTFFLSLSLVACCGCVEFEVLSATDDPQPDSSSESECSDEDPETQRLFYPDCDADGVFSSISTMACDINGANAAYECLDGSEPDGGWSLTQGTDCNDEDSNVSSNAIFYPDCDGDGVFSDAATKACGPLGADLAFDCLDGDDPEGGWTKEQGDDCNDEDETGSSFENWYPDCDGDGIHSPVATYACGALGADAAFDCSDGDNPDGGWSTIKGSDSDDAAGDNH